MFSNRETILSNVVWLYEDKLEGKTAHFRLPSASQKRACLSSLMSDRGGMFFLADFTLFQAEKSLTVGHN